eukprot:9227136-Lingulodinium_polyedra.AAC.1
MSAKSGREVARTAQVATRPATCGTPARSSRGSTAEAPPYSWSRRKKARRPASPPRGAPAAS